MSSPSAMDQEGHSLDHPLPSGLQPVPTPSDLGWRGAPQTNYTLHKAEEAYFAYGDHADVYRGRFNSKLVVIKQLKGVDSNRLEVRDNLHKDLWNSWATTWQHLDHPNVCKIYLIAEGFGFLPALVTDYYHNGSIINYIEKKQPSFFQRLQWARDIAEGLTHLHSFAIYHRDLRCANIFLDDSNRAVLADYGISHHFNNSDFTLAKSTGAVRWTGPEVISLPPDPNPKLDKLDIFALGMTILEVFSGTQPFQNKSDTDAIFAIANNELPKLPEVLVFNPDLTTLFQECTRKDPSQRPAAKDVAARLQDVMQVRHSKPSLGDRVFRVCLLGMPIVYSVRVDALETGALQRHQLLVSLQTETMVFLTISAVYFASCIAVSLAPGIMGTVVSYFICWAMVSSFFAIVLTVLRFFTLWSMENTALGRNLQARSFIFCLSIPAVWQIWSNLAFACLLFSFLWNYTTGSSQQNPSELGLQILLVGVFTIGLMHTAILLYSGLS